MKNLSKAHTYDLTAELRNRGFALILWVPGDMYGFGDPAVPAEERLLACRKHLEGRLIEVGWEVIDGILGSNEGES